MQRRPCIRPMRRRPDDQLPAGTALLDPLPQSPGSRSAAMSSRHGRLRLRRCPLQRPPPQAWTAPGSRREPRAEHSAVEWCGGSAGEWAFVGVEEQHSSALGSHPALPALEVCGGHSVC